MESETPSREIRVIAVAISIALAWFTYKFIESPIRFGKHSQLKTIILLISMFVIGCIGFYCYKQNGFEFRVKDFVKITRAAGEWQYPGDLKSFTFKDRIFRYKKSQREETTLFIGDSNIEQYYVRIDELINKNPTSTNGAIFSTGGGCIPVPSVKFDSYKHCFDLLEKSLELALVRNDISTVVIGGLWFKYLSGEAPRYFDGKEEKLSINKGTAGYDRTLESLSHYIEVLTKNNKKVFLVLNIPIGSELDPKFMAHRSIKNFPNVLEVKKSGILLQSLDEKYGFIRNDLKRVAELKHARIIDPIEYLCTKGICPSTDMDSEPIYKDDVHLRPSFVRKNASFMDSTIFAGSQ